MDKIDNGGSAFPIDSYMLNPNATVKEIKEAQGMTRRDYFVAVIQHHKNGGGSGMVALQQECLERFTNSMLGFS